MSAQKELAELLADGETVSLDRVCAYVRFINNHGPALAKLFEAYAARGIASKALQQTEYNSVERAAAVGRMTLRTTRFSPHSASSRRRRYERPESRSTAG